MSSSIRVAEISRKLAGLVLVVCLLSLHSFAQGGGNAAARTTREDSSEYGVGGHQETDLDSDGKVIEVRIFDAKGVLRHRKRLHSGLPQQGSSQTVEYYSETGALQRDLTYTFGFHDDLQVLSRESYRRDGSVRASTRTDYTAGGIERTARDPVTHEYKTTSTPYKKPEGGPSKTETALPSSTVPQTESIGLLLARDYHPGDTVSGSLWKSSYAENFKPVPGLAEYTFPLRIDYLPDGSPNWSSVELGLKGYGYAPVNPQGLFSLRIPSDWKGPLQLQARSLDSFGGTGPTSANFQIADPVASPALPQNLFPASLRQSFDYDDADHLVDLWNRAFDLEEERRYYRTHDEDYPGQILDIAFDLDRVYDEIDCAPDYLPRSVIVSMAQRMAKRDRDLNADLRTLSLTPAQDTSLQEYDRWADFLDGEAATFSRRTSLLAQYELTPYWISPLLSQDKLGVIRGPFSGRPGSTHLFIDDVSVPPISITPQLDYFMPTPGLTAGEHTLEIDSPGMPRTTLPFFYMYMTLTADQPNLHKGMKTTYHLKLDFGNKFPSWPWNSSFFPSDLVNPSDLQGASMPGPSQKGMMTLSTVNGSPGTISMKNVFETLYAQTIPPQGTVLRDGGIGAIQDGSFTILGEARAYTQPELGLGLWPGISAPSSHPFANDAWNFAPTSSPANLSCPMGSGTTLPTTPAGASSGFNFNLPMTHCMGSAALDDYLGALGGQTAEIGSPPVQDDADKARARYADAKNKVEMLRTRYSQTYSNEQKAWDNAMSKLPAATRNELPRLEQAFGRALFAWDDAIDALIKNSSAANGAALEAASVARADAQNAYEKARQAAIDQFTAEDRAAWEAARDAKAAADIDLELGLEEERDAREAADKLPLSTWLKYAF